VVPRCHHTRVAGGGIYHDAEINILVRGIFETFIATVLQNDPVQPGVAGLIAEIETDAGG
jgi:hypothetical protein